MKNRVFKVKTTFSKLSDSEPLSQIDYMLSTNQKKSASSSAKYSPSTQIISIHQCLSRIFMKIACCTSRPNFEGGVKSHKLASESTVLLYEYCSLKQHFK